jgi:EAL domain-containing protein (putative c-di-GMP-specific phosphodiesterase class I)
LLGLDEFISEGNVMLSIEQIEFYYQPVYNRELEIHGFEILSRLRSSGHTHGAEFIQRIENSELIVDLTLKQISTACELLDRGIDCKFSININEFTLSSERFLKGASRIPLKYLDRVSLEISEKIKFSGCENLIIALGKLDKFGYKLGLDDFFSENSTTLPIMTAKISYIKADMSIIRSFKESQVNRNLLKTMVYYCDLSSIPCVAEGVERLDTYYELYGMGINFFQGYLFSKPVPLDEMILIYERKKISLGNLEP